ncbi:MAG TPA: hypothetical protein VFH77_18175, partial [Streptomyces sp.]|nr:hypothetical protein [Streptomyces sp.]
MAPVRRFRAGAPAARCYTLDGQSSATRSSEGTPSTEAIEDFEEYVRSRQDALLRSARRLVPDPIDAQDLVQTA